MDKMQQSRDEWPPRGLRRPGVILGILLGVLLPVYLVAIDPGLFRGEVDFFFGTPLLDEYKLVCWALMALEVVTLAVAMGLRAPSPATAAVLSGLLLPGAVFAFCLGLSLLPLVGLGVVPMVTGAVYWNWSRWMWHASHDHDLPPVGLRAAQVAACLTMVAWIVPVQVGVDEITEAVVDSLDHGSEVEVFQALDTLERWGWALPITPVYEGLRDAAYADWIASDDEVHTTPSQRLRRYARAMQKICGGDAARWIQEAQYASVD